jgi:hypothetical protein
LPYQDFLQTIPLNKFSTSNDKKKNHSHNVINFIR